MNLSLNSDNPDRPFLVKIATAKGMGAAHTHVRLANSFRSLLDKDFVTPEPEWQSLHTAVRVVDFLGDKTIRLYGDQGDEAKRLEVVIKDKTQSSARRERAQARLDEIDKFRAIMSDFMKTGDFLSLPLQWVIRNIIPGIAHGTVKAEDIDRYIKATCWYMARRQSLKVKKPNVQWPPLQEMTLEFMNQHMATITPDYEREYIESILERYPVELEEGVDYSIKAKADGYMLFHLKTEKAAILFGEGSEWCTQFGAFKTYADGLMCAIGTHAQAGVPCRVQIHLRENQIMDKNDHDVSARLEEMLPGLTQHLVESYDVNDHVAHTRALFCLPPGMEATLRLALLSSTPALVDIFTDPSNKPFFHRSLANFKDLTDFRLQTRAGVTPHHLAGGSSTISKDYMVRKGRSIIEDMLMLTTESAHGKLILPLLFLLHPMAASAPQMKQKCTAVLCDEIKIFPQKHREQKPADFEAVVIVVKALFDPKLGLLDEPMRESLTANYDRLQDAFYYSSCSRELALELEQLALENPFLGRQERAAEVLAYEKTRVARLKAG